MAAREDFFTTFSLEFLIEPLLRVLRLFKQFDLASFGEGFHPTVQIGNKKWTGVRGAFCVSMAKIEPAESIIWARTACHSSSSFCS